MSDDAGATEIQHPERREFLSASAKITAVLALAGLGGTAHAATEAQTAMVSMFSEAIESGNMSAAVTKYGDRAGLTTEQKATLNTITSSELTAVKSFKIKVGGVTGENTDTGDSKTKVGIIFY